MEISVLRAESRLPACVIAGLICAGMAQGSSLQSESAFGERRRSIYGSAVSLAFRC